MLVNVKKKSIPLILLNARITKKSYKKWKMISFLSKFLFGSFDISFPQNYETKKYLNSLGSKKIKFVDLGKPLRLILTGVTNGPTINEIFYILGRSNIIKRIDNFLF